MIKFAHNITRFCLPSPSEFRKFSTWKRTIEPHMNTTNDLLDKSCSTNPKAKRTQNRISWLQVPMKDLSKKQVLVLFKTTKWVCTLTTRLGGEGVERGLTRGDGKHGTCGPPERRPVERERSRPGELPKWGCLVFIMKIIPYHIDWFNF